MPCRHWRAKRSKMPACRRQGAFSCRLPPCGRFTGNESGCSAVASPRTPKIALPGSQCELAPCCHLTPAKLGVFFAQPGIFQAQLFIPACAAIVAAGRPQGRFGGNFCVRRQCFFTVRHVCFSAVWDNIDCGRRRQVISSQAREKAGMSFWRNAGNLYERGFGGNKRKRGCEKSNHQKKIFQLSLDREGGGTFGKMYD